ncbi:sensor histidine kinase [Solirubrobacter sp. CPCC 204708]|uniref:histidine kinase n=2 Tax=Solirubrobacter deserti TaxID=2282478 RepID=A0ABT4RQH6_9ACTN|nr:sensor histidine kinase [Solirubrobacter deserti]
MPNSTVNIASSSYDAAASAGSSVVAARTLTASTAAMSPSSPTLAMMCKVSSARRAVGPSLMRARPGEVEGRAGRVDAPTDMPPLSVGTPASSSATVANRISSERTARSVNLILEEEIGLSRADEDEMHARRYRGGVSSRLFGLAAVVLTVSGEAEVWLGSAGEEGGRLVSALAVPAMAMPLAWSRRAPLPTLAAVALVLFVQAVLGGFLVGEAATTIIVLALVLYVAGGRLTGVPAFAAAAAAAAAVAVTRIVFDSSAQEPHQALLTFAAVACPLVLGRWARDQDLLRRELADRVARRARDRERDARQAADQERARIAADLQVAVAGALRAIAGDAQSLPALLRSGDHVTARERLAAIAGTARAALADVRRVLGVLRRDGEAPSLAPPRADILRGGEPLPPATNPPAAMMLPSRSAPVTRRRLGAVTDHVLVAAVLVVGAVELALVGPGGAWLTAVALAVPLLRRRRRPVAVAAGVLAAITTQSQLLDLDSFPLVNMLAMVVANYAIGAYATRGHAVGGLLLVAAGAAVHAAVFYPEGVVAALLGGVVLPWTIGRVVSGNRRLMVVEREKDVEVERSRARQAAAAVTSERTRMARELHDAVAHHISVIAIQAGGADGIVERDPRRVAQIAALIASVAHEALAELGRLADLPTANAPGLGVVERLVEPARAAGLHVELRVDDRARTLPAGIDLAAFRIVQEALTNTAKHADAHHAWVTVRCPGRALELEIADDGRGPDGSGPAPGGGHGLVGMRERVALYGGSLDLGRHGSGGFLVRARLPIEGV